tara:strand:- start:83 stop:406 length:324 start_codon:yes stop_codon:yes gene_type:complete
MLLFVNHSRVPSSGEMFQVDELGRQYVPIGTGGTKVSNSQNKVMYDSTKAFPNSVESFDWYATDERGGKSETATVVMEIGPVVQSSGGGSATTLAAGNNHCDVEKQD